MAPTANRCQPETTPERNLKLQSRYGGIIARLGSWFLYAKNAPQIATVEQAIPMHEGSTMPAKKKTSKASKTTKAATKPKAKQRRKVSAEAMPKMEDVVKAKGKKGGKGVFGI